MTSLITETCLSLRPIGLSTALGQAFCPPGLLEQPGPARPGTASRPVPSMAGSAFADGSMMYRCDGWGLNICARLRGGSPARSAVLAQLMAAIGQGGREASGAQQAGGRGGRGVRGLRRSLPRAPAGVVTA